MHQGEKKTDQKSFFRLVSALEVFTVHLEKKNEFNRPKESVNWYLPIADMACVGRSKNVPNYININIV